MKRNPRRRQSLGRWISQGIGQGLVVAPLLFVLVAGAGCPSLFQSDSQRAVHIRQAVVGRDGAKTIVGAMQVNDYAVLNLGAAKGATAITVDDIANLKAHFSTDLARGDLVLIIQMAGASMDSSNTASYGTVSAANLGNAGHYEFAGVEAVSGNRITLACGLKNDYNGPAGKTQVIRVPQYTTLTIPASASIVPAAWDGSVGGVVAVHAETTLTLDGRIDVSAMGFRGGAVDNAASNSGITDYVSDAAADGAEKGEGIVGYATDYDTLGGRFGRGAPANGGGGGDAHNAGGGGGANARHGVAYTGQGVMTINTTSDGQAWLLDPNYAGRSSEGGGRGGYSYSNVDATQADPTVDAPGATVWDGDHRRQVGGLGGHPLDSDPALRLFLGGGGGAGDGNNGVAGRGGRGGGLVFVIAGTVNGGGSILANGEAGSNAPDGTGGGDAAGGGGGGGTIVVHAVNLTGISLVAEGGTGGLQTGTLTDTEGPGGGGGGGYIAVSGGTPTVSAKGGLAGTTSHAVMQKFPANGATAGNDGQSDGDADTFLYCGMDPANSTLTATIDTHPDNPSGSAQSTFTFSANEGGVTFRCAVDLAADAGAADANWKACGSPYGTGVLPDGGHTFYVEATDLSGNTATASYPWTIVAGLLDAGVLQTTIVTGPPKVSGSAVGTFTFSNNHPPVTYQCAIDATDTSDWKSCSSPYTTPVLADGNHTFYVRATDVNGTTEAPPASYTWTIVAGLLDSGVFQTTILTGPPAVSGSPVGTFTFTNSHPPVTYQCAVDALDAGAWKDCGSPYTTPVLTDGDHTFYVRATDVNGSTESPPVQYTWTIATGSSSDGGAPDGGNVIGPTLDAHTDDVLANDVAATQGGDAVSPPTQDLDAGLDGELDGGIGFDAGGVPSGAADALDLGGAERGDAGTGTSGPDAASRPEPGADAALANQDAAVQVENADAAASSAAPSLLGGGFCAVAPSRSTSPAAFVLLALAALTVLARRRSR